MGESKESDEVKAVRAEIQDLEEQKEAAVGEQDFEKAASFKTELDKLKKKLTKMTKKKTTKAGGITGMVRGLVSKKKMRFQQDGFDLDLTYVTERLPCYWPS